MANTYTANNALIIFSVDGANLDNTSWDYFEGGEITPENTVIHAGGMAPGTAQGSGLRTRGDITLRRFWTDSLISDYITLDNLSGTASCKASVTQLNAAKATVAKPFVYTGVLGVITRPNYDSTSGTPLFLQVTFTPNETVSQG